jgi:hypothetical protein
MADDVSDSEEQKKKFEDDPEGYNQYCRDLEGELNKRFTLVRPLIQPNSVPPFQLVPSHWYLLTSMNAEPPQQRGPKIIPRPSSQHDERPPQQRPHPHKPHGPRLCPRLPPHDPRNRLPAIPHQAKRPSNRPRRHPLHRERRRRRIRRRTRM